MKTIYITIGNSDDKLSQAEWAAFHMGVHDCLTWFAKKTHGSWVSASASYRQNACWCIDLDDEAEAMLRTRLTALAYHHRQDSIAWAEAEVQLLTPVTA